MYKWPRRHKFPHHLCNWKWPFRHTYAPACNISRGEKKRKCTGPTKVYSVCSSSMQTLPRTVFVPPDRWQPASKVWLHSPQFERRQTGTPGGRRGQRQRQKSRLVAHGQGKRRESHSTTEEEQRQREKKALSRASAMQCLTPTWRASSNSIIEVSACKTPVTCLAFLIVWAPAPPIHYTAAHLWEYALILISAYSAGITLTSQKEVAASKLLLAANKDNAFHKKCFPL